jgi:hypothetical protein
MFGTHFITGFGHFYMSSAGVQLVGNGVFLAQIGHAEIAKRPPL